MVLDYSCRAVRGSAARRMRSAINYFAGMEATCRITSVDDQLRVLDYALVVVVGVIGGDEHAIVLVEVLQRRALHVQVILAPATPKWEIGIVVADLGTRLAQEFDDRERGGFA